MIDRDDADPTLAEALDRGDNSYNLIRLAAAVAVVVSHSCALLRGEVVGEPLSGLTPYTLGQHAVNVFFVLSGVMLSRSWSLRPDLWRFVRARLLRIYPGLAACGVVVAFALAPFGVSDAQAYLADPATFTYPLRVLVEFGRAKLGGVFPSGSLNPGAVNYSLWTIKYELAAYVVFVAAAAVGLVRRPAFAVAFLLGTSACVVVLQVADAGEHALALVPAGRFFMSFAIGVAAFAFRRHVPLAFHCLAAFLALAVGLRHTPLVVPATILFTGYLALYLGGLSVTRVSAWAQRTDLSYGLYLYAWPVQQLLLFRWPGIGLPGHVAASLAGATVLAACSWRFVERPALRLKGSDMPRVRGDGDAGAGRIGSSRTRPWLGFRHAPRARVVMVSLGTAAAAATASSFGCVAHLPIPWLGLC